MNKFVINYIDCAWDNCKNTQFINSIEMFFFITLDDEAAIEYNFHSVDFHLWEQIVEIHKENVNETTLYYLNDVITINDIKDKYEYYNIKIVSKDMNLYRNINLIMYLTDNDKWDNMNEMLRKNTWKGRMI